MENAATPLEEINRQIAAAAKIAQRESDDITLIAVSKTHPEESILPLLEQGHRVFGENRVQEAQAKWPRMREKYPDAEVHLIGRLQSNKADDAVTVFDCIHSLDRPGLVTALGKAMNKAGRRIPCFIQVDVGEEDQKGGCAISALPDLLSRANDAGIPVIGLMCIPPLAIEPAPFFALLDKLATDHDLPGRSMGMSSDFRAAIMMGATHIRVGTALFGARGRH
ncbi:YggS family pyridoxal phosphate-dependent enzyme [Altererythrobacter aquiaggeris]|uniref:YggS family pyridoxal phosphate-dependent enzyme n=1 Tax=Aestuarierythrobacter aquiaggeris TaxID=1898396 RepID=UPI0030182FB3